MIRIGMQQPRYQLFDLPTYLLITVMPLTRPRKILQLRVWNNLLAQHVITPPSLRVYKNRLHEDSTIFFIFSLISILFVKCLRGDFCRFGLYLIRAACKTINAHIHTQ